MKPGRSGARLWQQVTLMLLLSITLSWCVGCATAKPVVLLESEEVQFLPPGAVFTNTSSQELVIISKGSYVLLVEAAESTLKKEK